LILASYTFDVLFTTRARGKAAPGRVLDPLMIDPASGRYFTEIPLEEMPYFRMVAEFLSEHIGEL
jgi:hypothetical protein